MGVGAGQDSRKKPPEGVRVVALKELAYFPRPEGFFREEK